MKRSFTTITSLMLLTMLAAPTGSFANVLLTATKTGTAYGFGSFKSSLELFPTGNVFQLARNPLGILKGALKLSPGSKLVSSGITDLNVTVNDPNTCMDYNVTAQNQSNGFCEGDFSLNDQVGKGTDSVTYYILTNPVGGTCPALSSGSYTTSSTQLTQWPAFQGGSATVCTGYKYNNGSHDTAESSGPEKVVVSCSAGGIGSVTPTGGC